MELRAYWQVLKRRWLLVVLPAIVVLVIGLITYDPPAQAYNVGVRFIAGQEPSQLATESDEQRLANWQTSEYIVNTLSSWVRGGQFAGLVSQRLAEQGIDMPAPSIQASIAADDARSMMTLYMTYSDPVALEEMMDAAATVLMEQNSEGLPQLGGEQAEFVQLDEPLVNPVPAGILDQLELPLRITLAIGAGVGLAFLVEYLDPTVRDREEVESMGIAVVGEIPRA
jgi:capsular polysaccharide biosynthesis protein